MSDPLGLREPLPASQYAIWGIVLMLLKSMADRAVAGIFGHSWDFSSFLMPFGVPRSVLTAQGNDQFYLITLALVALPFIALGTALTYRRVRSIGWPSATCLLFFVPFVNWLLFTAALVAPDWDREVTAPRWLPSHRTGAAVLAVLLTATLGLLLTWGYSQILSYGWGLFLGIPFCLGFISTWLNGLSRNPSIGQSVRASLIAALAPSALLSGLLLAFAVEGIVCLVMAAPIAIILGLLGGLLAHAMLDGRGRRYATPILICAVLLSPTIAAAERWYGAAPELLRVVTSVEINAPPDRVWQSVVEFPDLAAPTEMVFRAGIAYPIRARLQGTGVGAIRYCEFSTGPFIEPITIWDEPRRLRFAVTHNPEPMQEWTPYYDVHPPHLKGFMESQQGQFHLVPLPGGRTRLEGTTWYRHGLWPARYWQLWSDHIIHTIHLRVLRHIKAEAEKG